MIDKVVFLILLSIGTPICLHHLNSLGTSNTSLTWCLLPSSRQVCLPSGGRLTSGDLLAGFVSGGLDNLQLPLYWNLVDLVWAGSEVGKLHHWRLHHHPGEVDGCVTIGPIQTIKWYVAVLTVNGGGALVWHYIISRLIEFGSILCQGGLDLVSLHFYFKHHWFVLVHCFP